MKFIPKSHHSLSIGHLMDNDEAGLFAGMGLGKTASTLTAFAGKQLLGDATAALVIAPIRVAALTWPNEIAKWDHLRHLRWASLRKPEGYRALEQGKADIYLINYEQLQKFARLYLQKNRRLNFDTVIYDELTAAKSPGSKRMNAVRRSFVPERGVQRRWGLTGTPTPNSMMELYGQIRALDHGARFGPSFAAWRDAHFEQADYMGYSWKLRPGAQAKIYAKINDMVLSLPQSEYSSVPAPIEHDIEVPLPDKARDQYDEIEKHLLLLLEDETEVVAVTAGALLQKLLQICGGAVYRQDKTVAHIHDAKLDAARAFRAKHKGEPLIIACNYKHEKARLLKAIPKAIPFQDSPDFLRNWNAGKIETLVVDPREISHGLNMQEGGAKHVLWFSPMHSREKYDQLNGRLAREGQVNQVHVTRIVCPGTADDAVVEALRQRGAGQQALMDTLLNIKRLAS